MRSFDVEKHVDRFQKSLFHLSLGCALFLQFYSYIYKHTRRINPSHNFVKFRYILWRNCEETWEVIEK